MTPLDLIFTGAGEFGLPTLRALLGAQHRIVQVVSQPDRPAGRGKKLTPTPISRFAEEQRLPLLRTQNINRETLPPADLMVVIAFGQKISPAIVNHPRLGSVNLHASILPRFRGAAPINWAMLAGDSTTGNSVIRLAERMDAGAVLGHTQLPIGPLETAGELHDRLAEDGAPLMLRVIEAMANGSAVEVAQDETKATLAPKLGRELTRIDWSLHAERIATQIRGLSPWPGCHVRLLTSEDAEAGRLLLIRARALRSGTQSKFQPGTIDDAGLIVAGEGTAVELIEVQPEGKRAMLLDAYRNGHPWSPGMRLESL